MEALSSYKSSFLVLRFKADELFPFKKKAWHLVLENFQQVH